MDCEAVRTGATVAAAFGTVGAVVLALHRDYIRAKRRRPRLDLRFDGTGADQDIVGTEGGFEAACIRMRVTNEKGRDTADDVQVLVTEVRTANGSSKVTPIGLPLIWTGSLPAVTVAPVHPDFQRHINLLHVDEPVAKDELGVVDKLFGETSAELDVYPKPAGGQHLLAAGKHEIRLEVVARNADAARYTVAVEWGGKWPGKAKIWQSLRVQPPRKQKH
jgi:hypothetical protein